jgi:hypothetical protein
MTASDIDKFGRRVRGLDPETLTQFVADLYAARGFETTVTGEGCFVATRPRDGDEEARTVRVARSIPSEPDSECAIVARRVDVESAAGTEVRDLRALYRMALYAVEREQLRAISIEYFDEDWKGGQGRAEDRHGDRGRDGNGAGRRAAEWVESVWPSVETPVNPPAALFAVLIAVAVVAVLVATMGGSGESTTGPGIERTVTPAPVPTQQQATSTDALGPAGSDICPAPPAEGHLVSLRPVPVQAALSTGLESWELQLSVNSSVFYGPSPLEIRWEPERRHKSTYRMPDGEDIVLTVDQWNGSATAERAGRALAIEYGLSVVWGQYTFTVTYNSATTNASVERRTARATSRLLLSQVTAPDGGKLGQECLDTLLLERTA